MTVTAFLKSHIAALRRSHDVTVITNTANPLFLEERGISVSVVPLALARTVRPIRDVACLFHLLRIFRAGRFDVVFSVTPKAGLLAMLAGFLARVPVRIHMFTGQVWATRIGLARRLLKTADRFLGWCATNILIDSHSQRRFLISAGVVDEGRSSVLAGGSICGVDDARFRPDREAANAVRRALNVPRDVPLLLFLGRITRDKGVLDLAKAFARLVDEGRDIHLAMVGPDEGGLALAIQKICARCATRVHFVGFIERPEHFMAAADIFCLPSYREGFGAVVIEAAAIGVPAVASAIYGVTDAVVDGETGLLHPPGDHDAMVRCLATLIDDPDLRQRMGHGARERAIRDFGARRVTGALLSYIQRTFSECRGKSQE